MKKLFTILCIGAAVSLARAQEAAITTAQDVSIVDKQLVANDLKSSKGVLQTQGFGEIIFDYDLAHLNFAIGVEGETQIEAQNKLADAQKLIDDLILQNKIDQSRVMNGNAEITTTAVETGIIKSNIKNTYTGSLLRVIDFSTLADIAPFAEAAKALKLDAKIWLEFEKQNVEALAEQLVAASIADANRIAQADAQNANVAIEKLAKLHEPELNISSSPYQALLFDKNGKLLPFEFPKGSGVSFATTTYHISAPEMTHNPETVMEISAIAEKTVAPEYATTSIRVSETGKTIEQVEAALAKRIGNLKEALKASGLPEADIKIGAPLVNYIYPESKSIFISKYVEGFESHQDVSIEFKDMTKISEVLAKMVEAGFDSYEEVSFHVRDEKPIVDEVRKAAFEKVFKIAQGRAKAVGMKLGAPIEVNMFTENDGVGNLGYEAPIAASADYESKERVKQIETKIEDIRFVDSVKIRYELLPN